MSDTHTNDQEAGSHSGPASVVPAADPLTPTFRMLLADLREQRRANGRLWLRAFAPRDRQDFLIDRLEQAAELESLDERGDLDGYWLRVIRRFSDSMNDPRQRVDIVTPTTLAA